MTSRWQLAAFAVLLQLVTNQTAADPLPRRIGQCTVTEIKSIGSRLAGNLSSGSAVTYANGGYQVSYNMIAQITRSRVGDPVRLCLTSLPRDCPKGDDRGKTYRATNLRTDESWELPDAAHGCGGA